MNSNYKKREIYCLVICCILTSFCTTSLASAAISKFIVSGKVMETGDTNDIPVKDAVVQAVKFTGNYPNPPVETVAAQALSGDDGAFSLYIDVDESLGAADLFNKIQIRLEGSEYVTGCSPFLELLNFKGITPPVGNLQDLELSPILLNDATVQLKAISDIEGEDDVDPAKGILVGSVEYDNGEDIINVAGVRFTINGNNIDGARTMYMDDSGKWNRMLDRTTSGGPFIIYNIPIDPITGWTDLGLTYDLADESQDYILGVYPWVRVYAYEKEGKHFITDAHYKADKYNYEESNDESGSDDGGGGGGGICFISLAS